MNTSMYKTKCGRKGCDHILYTYAIDRQGTLPVVFCSERCKGEVAYDKKFRKL